MESADKKLKTKKLEISKEVEEESNLKAKVDKLKEIQELQQIELRQSWYTMQNAILNFFSTFNPAKTQSHLSRYFEENQKMRTWKKRNGNRLGIV